MGNILCLPKKCRKSDAGSGKKKRKGSSKRSCRLTLNVEKEKVLFSEDTQPSDNNIDEKDPQTRSSSTADFYICPVVSSSILLRHDYDDDDEKLDDHNEKKQVGQTDHSPKTESRSAVVNESNEKIIENNNRMLSLVENLNEEATRPTPKITTKEEQFASVRVIRVEEITDSLSPESVHIDNKEENNEVDELPKEKPAHEKVQIGGTESIGLGETIKDSEPRKTKEDSTVLYTEVEKNIGRPTLNEAKEDSICNKTVDSKTKELIMDDIVSYPIKVTDDEENVKGSRVVAVKVLEENTPFTDVTHVKETDNADNKEEESRAKNRELLGEADDHGQVVSTSSIGSHLVSKSVKERKSVAGLADVETTSKELNCSSLPDKTPISLHIKEFGALLNVLSTLQTAPEKVWSDSVVPASSNKRLVFGPQSDSTDKLGSYKSKEGIENWIHNSKQRTPPSATKNGGNTNVASSSKKKVSDFNVPWKPRKLPPKPLPLKKPSSHLFKIPDVAKSDLEDDKVNWTQLEPKGPQTKVLWTTKPSAFDVKLPPLPKRLLERKGSVEKLQESWIIPQVKQIETLKRENGRFPGLVVPTDLRNKYSVNIEKEPDTRDESDECGLITQRDTPVKDVDKVING